MASNKKILVVGSVAFDSIETPFGKAERVLGGSAVYFSLSASLFSPVNLIGVVGEDFSKSSIELLEAKGIDVRGLERQKGDTFFWDGKYNDNLSEAITKETCLNVFEHFKPIVPEDYRSSEIVFLANIDPDLQLSVLSQVNGKGLKVSDTMNLWIENKKEALCKIFKQVDVVILNEGEAKLFTNEFLLMKAAEKIKSFGPKWVIIKKGEHGVFAFNGKESILLPSYPMQHIVDPTGAGDSFAGGFLGYLTQHPSLDRENVKKALLYGTIVASFTIESFSVDRLKSLDCAHLENRLSEFKEWL